MPWAWERHPFTFDGRRYAEWRGESAYHSAIVTNFPSGNRWQATMDHSDQRSPYRASASSARAWAERYGRVRT